MSLEGEDNVTPTREWIAVATTNIKASAALADTLAAEERVLANRGAHLTATLLEDDKNHWTISGGILDGVALPDSIRFVYKGHWQLKEQHAPVREPPAAKAIAEQAVAEPPPVTAETASLVPQQAPTPIAATAAPDAKPERFSDSSAKPPGQRRLFASFRRRLTQR